MYYLIYQFSWKEQKAKAKAKAKATDNLQYNDVTSITYN